MAFDRMAFVRKFSIEAREHVEKISQGLMDLEKSPQNSEILQEIFRSAHTLKGSARMLKLLDINQIAHKMEDLFGLVKENKLKLTADMTDLLLESLDAIEECLTAAIEQRQPNVNVEEQVNQLERALRNEPIEKKTVKRPVKERETEGTATAVTPSVETPDTRPPEKPEESGTPLKEPAVPPATSPPATSPAPVDSGQHARDAAASVTDKAGQPSVAGSGERPEDLQTQRLGSSAAAAKPGEVTTADTAPREHPVDEGVIASRAKAAVGDTIRIQVSRLDNLIKLISEIVLDRSKLGERIKNLNALVAALRSLQDSIKIACMHETSTIFSGEDDRMQGMLAQSIELANTAFLRLRDDYFQSQSVFDQIKDEILTLRMVPISTLFNNYPRSVRSLAKEFGKRINLEMSGEQTELDRKMIEDLNDPMVHLIRNAIDHGIEEIEDRIAAGKAAEGTIRLSAQQGRGTIIITIQDDGRGISIEKIKETALRKQLASRQELDELTNDRLLDFLFLPGFSTSRIITDISGRGVGLDVVKKNVEDKLKGLVNITSRLGEGTTFTIFLPVTLTTTQALLVRVGQHKIAIPYSYVQETHYKSPRDIIKVVDRTAINIRDQILPLVFLGKVLKLADYQETLEEQITTIILRSGQDRMVFIVDEIIDEQEIVIKPMGSFLHQVNNLSGITILGDGDIVLIIHVPDVIYAARVMSEVVPSHLRKMKRRVEKQKILVVDDSLNTREVEKNILEAHEYDVDVAADGEEAFDIASKKDFDLIVTDIEMPRVNGFELTKRLRASEKHRNTPIIIVTSRDKDEDRRKGIEIGADAYIVKSAFDEGNLIDTIETLIGPVS